MRVFLPALAHELLKVADRRFEAQPQDLDSRNVRVVGLLPSGLVGYEWFVPLLVDGGGSDRVIPHE